MIVNEFRTRAVPTVGCAYRSGSVPDTSVLIGLPTLKGLRPSPRKGSRLCPLAGRFLLATPGLADGQGCNTAPSGKSEARRRRIRRGTSFRRDRHRDAGDLHLHRAEVVAAGDVERPPVVAAEREVGGGGRPVHDAAELLAGRVHDPDAAGAP